MAQQFKAPVIEDFEADDIRAFYDSSVFRVWHLAGKERTYKIAKVQRITTEFRNEIRKRALLTLTDSKGRAVPLPLELNPTNRKVVQQLYGNNPREWVGRLVTLYPTTTDMAGQTVDCIRVRPMVPGKASSRNKQGVTVAASAVIAARPAPAPAAQASNGADEDPSDAEGDDLSDADDSDQADDEPPPGALETDTQRVSRGEDVIQ